MLVNFDLDKLTSEQLVKAVESAGDGKTYKVSDIKTIKKIAIAFVAVSVEPRKVEERGAPKKLASLADIR